MPPLREDWPLGQGVPEPKEGEKVEAHLALVDDDEPTLLMTTFCALHDIEAEEKLEEVVVAKHGEASQSIDLDEPHAQVHLGRVGGEVEQRWYLDSGASNHMIGSKADSIELNDSVTG